MANTESFIVGSMREVALFCGRTVQNIQQWQAQGMPGEPRRYDLSAIVQWKLDRGDKRRRKKIDDEADPLLKGPDSPWLEEYRKEKTLTARLQRLEMERQLMDVGEVKDGLVRIMGTIRNAGDTIQRRPCPECYEILDTALEEADEDVERTFDSDSNSTD